ncbi:hypothetical protein AALO_G00088820 [Alosa alosa]|uniref:Ig-like domain-containing protein n=1 Tax=Alosa alosa TaxID=278164 RepID=A0AAV6H347_9TELE|nr:hypothetical protein AALO_G00088820 [Alosa alosa]
MELWTQRDGHVLVLATLLASAVFGVPSPVVTGGGNDVTLTCRVAQRRRSSSLPVVRWMFARNGPGVAAGERDPGGADAAAGDRGTYTCRAQEFRRHKDRWKASTNSSASTELRVHVHPASVPRDALWSLFEGVCLFTVVVCCQYLQRKRKIKENYHLVKSPQNSSGEVVTSEVSVSPALPKKERKYKNRLHTQQDTPPEIPAKAPIGEKMRNPKLIKVPPRNLLLPKIVEESLTYAELELVKARPTARPTAPAQLTIVRILFEEQHV